ncbi:MULTISPECIES: sensor histidine kinase [Pseudonocardia]|uniref:histidine kinase n=2 Tax=Pseudonocardia TaxID=1847 RepID=A0A1Y2MU00_PSEAH|nr:MULTISPECIES: histidine kinase [Pseudonocardia]OSY38670.1 Sensor histidine kinase DesK [Pseudonocardia autotrophica]TDN74872.1 signal transduction histidine kinase [Pseudonocardia autotrophica]BBF98811.1 two-component sensor histidine kinase [Pseudonocardia autotrophica]GEC26529.1 two-component sensor histidine kinase [Pseudonocardia saturnea]
MTATPIGAASPTRPRRAAGLSAAASPARDAAVATAVVIGLWWTVPPEIGRPAQAGLALVVVLAVVLRHRFPRAATAVAALSTGVAWLSGATADPGVLVGWCLFAVAERQGERLAPNRIVAATAVVALLLLLTVAPGDLGGTVRWAVVTIVVLTAAWVLGVRTRRLRRETAVRVATEERLRLSRDVHDALGHSLGTIGVRAGVAAHVDTLSADELREALREIAETARCSVAELHVLLGRIRDGESAGTDLPTDLRTLARTMQRSGIDAAAEIEIDPDIDTDAVSALAAPLRTTLYRVAQEATTNVVRHSGATRCRITLTLTGPPADRWITLCVTDDGRGPGAAPPGHGLTGMEERVHAHGGTLRTGGPPGFTLTATLPATTAARDPQ